MCLFLFLESLPPPPWSILRIFQLYLPQQESAIWRMSSCFFIMCTSAHCQFNSSGGCFACVHPTIGLAFLAPNDINFFPLQPVLVYFPLCTLNINSCARRASNSNIIFIKLQCRLRDVGEREVTLQMYHVTVGLRLENFFVRVYQ